MELRAASKELDPASEAVLHVQREMLLRLGAALLASQRSAVASVEAEIDHTVADVSRRLADWRCRMVKVVQLSSRLVIPWLLLLIALVVATSVLAVKTHNAWVAYRSASAAAQRLPATGSLTVVRKGQLYIRVDPQSLARSDDGQWYARVVPVELAEAH